MSQNHARKLLVEGKDDQYAIAELMAKHIHWGANENEWPVFIEAAGSDRELLDPSFISAQYKIRNLECLGIIIDADDSFEARWQQLRGVFIANELGYELPETFPDKGLICEHENGRRIGIWIMPDNCSRGMLEDFLKFLVPTASQELWEHAKTATEKAKTQGASFIDKHESKANIHTWLAWQNPPGRPFGLALLQGTLESHTSAAMAFVKWFVELFQLEGQRL